MHRLCDENIKSKRLNKLFQISRPRFWIYVFGPYLVGALCGAATLEALKAPLLWLFGAYFLLPANLLIYGVNDIFDYETDRRNPKKSGYEALLPPDERLFFWRAIALTNLPFAFLLPFLPGRALLAIGAFWFFSLFYSAPPIRTKTKPLLDSLFNVLYACPGFFAYVLAGGNALNLPVIMAAWCWTMAMHAFSAVPDIAADKASGMKTIATWLGQRGTIIFCALLYGAAAILILPSLGVLASLLGLLYGGLMLMALTRKSATDLMKIYRWFPLINTICGFVLFWWLALMKFGEQMI